MTQLPSNSSSAGAPAQTQSCLKGFGVAVPTYRRPQLLKELLEDIASQQVRPAHTIIVDGDPSSNAVLPMLRKRISPGSSIHYIASNHSNLPYQRYLAWRVASSLKLDQILYLDDDMRIPDADALDLLTQPLLEPTGSTVGVTSVIRFGTLQCNSVNLAAVHERNTPRRTLGSSIVRRFGSSRGLRAGTLTPSGHRIPPANHPGGSSEVHWLRGGVMAYRMSAITEECFSEDLFALAEIGCGHGEDTVLSRRIGSHGQLRLINTVHLDHPNLDPPKAYATAAYKMAWGTAYSRRLLNDEFRWPAPPRASDRTALLRSHAGTSLLHILAALRYPRLHRFSYAAGYVAGSIKSWIRPPSASHLTPSVNWRSDASRALDSIITL